jgi:hypothetical protein
MSKHQWDISKGSMVGKKRISHPQDWATKEQQKYIQSKTDEQTSPRGTMETRSQNSVSASSRRRRRWEVRAKPVSWVAIRRCTGSLRCKPMRSEPMVRRSSARSISSRLITVPPWRTATKAASCNNCASSAPDQPALPAHTHLFTNTNHHIWFQKSKSSRSSKTICLHCS